MRRATATIPTGPNAGRGWSSAIYAADASEGYKTSYARTPHRWLVVKMDGRTLGCWQYSGSRLDQAEADYATNVREMREAGADVVEHDERAMIAPAYGPAEYAADVARIDAGLSAEDRAMADRWRRSYGLTPAEPEPERPRYAFERSNGHVGYTRTIERGLCEVYERAGSIIRADMSSPLDADGYRMGGREWWPAGPRFESQWRDLTFATPTEAEAALR
ncbi:MAG TPA: hypothetical protein VFS32_13415 [Candidatus Limnocylindrales bacterium]|nr:hypothetical protein [Candidatus Limnocylindrales bacterium]